MYSALLGMQAQIELPKKEPRLASQCPPSLQSHSRASSSPRSRSLRRLNNIFYTESGTISCGSVGTTDITLIYFQLWGVQRERERGSESERGRERARARGREGGNAAMNKRCASPLYESGGFRFRAVSASALSPGPPSPVSPSGGGGRCHRGGE